MGAGVKATLSARPPAGLGDTETVLYPLVLAGPLLSPLVRPF